MVLTIHSLIEISALTLKENFYNQYSFNSPRKKFSPIKKSNVQLRNLKKQQKIKSHQVTMLGPNRQLNFLHFINFGEYEIHSRFKKTLLSHILR